MKKIIDGRLCNTETAKELGVWDNDLSHSDFDWCAESLYLTRAGQYFIHGRGGARSRYAERVEQNTWSGGENIYLVSRAEAMKWAETHLSPDDYAALFGEPAEAGDGTSDLIVGIPVAIKERLRIKAQELGVSMTAVVTEALEKHLA